MCLIFGCELPYWYDWKHLENYELGLENCLIFFIQKRTLSVRLMGFVPFACNKGCACVSRRGDSVHEPHTFSYSWWVFLTITVRDIFVNECENKNHNYYNIIKPKFHEMKILASMLVSCIRFLFVCLFPPYSSQFNSNVHHTGSSFSLGKVKVSKRGFV